MYLEMQENVGNVLTIPKWRAINMVLVQDTKILKHFKNIIMNLQFCVWVQFYIVLDQSEIAQKMSRMFCARFGEWE